MSLTLVSLFDGIGGFCRAFELAGAKTVATVEIDKPAAAVSARHFPHATQFDDVTKVTGNELRTAGFVPDRGIITAGWPCQDNSVAGRRKGLDGARSGLWWHVVRLLAETRPRWFVGENVPGLLSVHEGQDFGAVLGSLAELGYGVAYRVLDAQHFGVPQRRERVFIVGHLGEPWSAPAQVLLEPESSVGDSPPGGSEGQTVAAGVSAGAGGTGREIAPALIARYGKGSDGKGSDAFVIQSPDTHTQQLRRCRAAGDAATASTPNQRQAGTSSWREVVNALTADGVGTCGADDNQAQAGHLIADRAVVDVVGTLQTQCRGVPSSDEAGGGQLVIEHVCVTGDMAHTLTSEGADASEDGTGRGTPIVYQCHGSNVGPIGTLRQGNGGLTGGQPFMAHDTVVRRLTELECERLQGYPDGWTDGQSGAARYRQLGNSVAVPCVEWIARRLIAVDEELGEGA